LEYINHSIRVSDVTYKRSSRQPDAMIEAARWLGEFHATQQTRIAERSLSFLNRYDSPYYNAWARRTYQFARPLWKRFHWLSKIKASADHWFAPLLESPPTIIHGEFYAKNLLLQRENVFTIDWESAAIAPGEIDLAALTEGIHWPESIVQGCQRAYIRSRWPQGEPPSFQRTLDAARMYLHFRWLGERRDWAVRARTLWRYEDLYQTARRLALF
jgi:thiamine kinase-like enzyme